MKMGVLVEVFSPDSLKGRGVRAVSSIKAGTCVLEDEPYVYILNEEQLQLRCGHCLRALSIENKSEIGCNICKSCKKVVYCNKSCQDADSKEHRYECKVLQGKARDDLTLRLLTKLILKSKKCKFQKSNRSLNEFPSSFRDLCSSKLSLKARECTLRLFRRYEKSWRSKLRSHLSPFQGEEVLDTYEKLSINTFSMYDEMKRVIIGQALYIRASMFNHSCEPNCTFVFDGTRLTVRAIRNIQIGEECCISYMSSLLPTSLRQDKLRSTYGFICQCPRCLDIERDNLMLCIKCPNENCFGPVLPNQDGLFQTCNNCNTEVTSTEHSTAVSRVEAFSEGVLEEVKKVHRDTVESNSNSENDNRLVVILKQCLKEQSSLLHQTHHCVMRVRLEIMDACSYYGHWKEALEASKGLLDVLRLHLSREDPYIAFYLLKVSIIHRNLGETNKTYELLEQAIPLLETAYGDNHLVTQHAKELQLQSSQELHTLTFSTFTKDALQIHPTESLSQAIRILLSWDLL
ncbi:N-lysine methyltransferase SMYD2-like isoform X1 [Lytechinus variegatus]|uniref:N-lysine methyltransferase SMYD2-like isoform X1 n=1 Tax=Lytechinus variegatus TaxID=7654 RepID=UPI001BB13A8F|nr:N-lysine methyltransferase SMYD2-like isoform X1 [Lytechinus variegatus]